MELIKQYDSTNPAKGYNVAKGGKGTVGAKHSEETKRKLARLASERIKRTGKVNFKGQHHSEETKKKLREKALKRLADGQEHPFKGKHHSNETKAKLSELRNKPITQYSLNGQRITTYASLHDAAKTIGCSTSTISSCALKRTSQSAGYIWRYLDVDQLPPEEMPNTTHKLCKTVLCILR